jgi:hypothetical protein
MKKLSDECGSINNLFSSSNFLSRAITKNTMKFPETIQMNCEIHFKFTFWEALKLRLAGKAAQALVKELAVKIAEEE